MQKTVNYNVKGYLLQGHK